MPRTIDLTTTRHTLTALVRWVETHKQPIVLSCQGRGVAVLQSLSEARPVSHAEARKRTELMKRRLHQRLVEIRHRHHMASRKTSS